MDEASGVDDDDDSIGGRCVSAITAAERAVVRDLLDACAPRLACTNYSDARFRNPILYCSLA